MDNDGDQVMEGQVGQNVHIQAANPIPPEAIPPLLPGGIQMPPAAQPPIDPAVIDKGNHSNCELYMCRRSEHTRQPGKPV